MISYKLYTTFNQRLHFGKHKGEKLSHVLLKDPKYLKWCIQNIPNFYMSPSLAKKILNVVNGKARLNVREYCPEYLSEPRRDPGRMVRVITNNT